MGNERFGASFEFFKAKLTTALSIPENPSRRALLLKTRDVAMVTVANYIIPPVTMTETFSKSENLQAKPLVVLYLPGLGGGTAEGNSFYQGIHTIHPEIPWIAVNAQNPDDPDIMQWKREIQLEMKKNISLGKDIYLIGHSAGGAIVASILLDSVDESSEFYDPVLSDHIVHVLSLASPNITFPGSADRPKLRDLKLNKYPEIFRSYTISQLRKFQQKYKDKVTFVTGSLDRELYKEGNDLATALGDGSIETRSDHGLSSAQQQITTLFTGHIQVHEAQQTASAKK